MRKYFAFAAVILKQQFKKISDNLGTLLSFTIHISIFSLLWEFVLEGKTMAGYSKSQLVWYLILAEAIIYSYSIYYKKIAAKIEMGDFAYDLTKPYNFMLRIIAEGVAELPMTFVLMCLGIVLGIVYVGFIPVTVLSVLATFLVALMATTLLLMLHIIIGLLSIWLGRDVSSVWLLAQKAMLIFAFSPLELFPEAIRIPLMFLPTTHIIYTPASLLVNFSLGKFIFSLGCELLAGTVLMIILIIIYKKGVKKQNVEGV